jgi:YgiT-type zinc finger domain-containing protein
MICLICRQAETVDGPTSIHFERGEMRLVVNNVPARICPSCGEAYVDEDVAVRLLHEAEAISTAGELDNVIEYDHPNKLLDAPNPK